MNDQLTQQLDPPNEVAAMDAAPGVSWLWTPTTIVSVLAGLLLALAMVGGMFGIGRYYLGALDTPADDGKQKLGELRSNDERDLTTYGWINQQDGVVRIPIGRAMELLAKEPAPVTVKTPDASGEPTAGSAASTEAK